MTEEEWLSATERQIRDAVARLSPRRQRLLAVSACRTLGRWIDFPSAHAALTVAEVYADTGKTKAALRRARQAVQADRDALSDPAQPFVVNSGGVEMALFAVLVAASENAVASTVIQTQEAIVFADGLSESGARRMLYPSFRDVVGNPFRPVRFDPFWRTSTAVALARQMYESREFSLMPILADALQDAGCENADILAHCRDPQLGHVRGCWVVDLVLGKA